jgi:hypothetical protein
MSVNLPASPSAWNSSTPNGRIFHEIWCLRIFQISGEKIQVSLKSDENKGILYLKPIYICIIYRPFLLRIRTVSDKSCRENQKTHFVFSNICFRTSCCLWDNLENMVEHYRPQMTQIWRVRIACWIPKATNIQTQVVWCSLLFHCTNGCTNAPQCYVIHTLPGLLIQCTFCQYPPFCVHVICLCCRHFSMFNFLKNTSKRVAQNYNSVNFHNCKFHKSHSFKDPTATSVLTPNSWPMSVFWGFQGYSFVRNIMNIV